MYFLLNMTKMGDFPSQSSGHCRGKPTLIQPSTEKKCRPRATAWCNEATDFDPSRKGEPAYSSRGVCTGGWGVLKMTPLDWEVRILRCIFLLFMEATGTPRIGILLREVSLDLGFRPIHLHCTEFCGCGRSGHVPDMLFLAFMPPIWGNLLGSFWANHRYQSKELP